MKVIDDIVKKSRWYKAKFGDAFRIKQAPYHLDVMSLGSNPSKYGIDFTGCEWQGYSFAVGPQTLEFDLKILKKFYGHLSYMGPRLVLFVLCPFGTCKSFYRDIDGEVCKNARYYPILNKEDIPNYDEQLNNFQVLHPTKYVVKNLKTTLAGEVLLMIKHDTTKKQTVDFMQKSAENYIRNWKREFQLDDLEPTHISDYVKEALQYNRQIVDEVVDFCKEHELHPFLVMPPLTKELNALIPDGFKERCTYSVVRRNDIHLMDYSMDERFCQHSYFMDALKMNKQGRLLFTNQLVKDLQQMLAVKNLINIYCDD